MALEGFTRQNHNSSLSFIVVMSQSNNYLKFFFSSLFWPRVYDELKFVEKKSDKENDFFLKKNLVSERRLLLRLKRVLSVKHFTMDECPLKKLRKDDALESTEDADILKNLHEPQGPSVISFASNFNENQGKIRLFEINPDIVARIEAGESLKIIGGETGEAVLCTKDSTFSIKKVETSNHGKK